MSQKTFSFFAALLCCVAVFGQKPKLVSLGISLSGENEHFDPFTENWYQQKTLDEFDFGDLSFSGKRTPWSGWQASNYSLHSLIDVMPERWVWTSLELESTLGYFSQWGHHLGDYEVTEEIVPEGVKSIREFNSVRTDQRGASLSTHALFSLKWKRLSLGTGAGFRVGRIFESETKGHWLRLEEITNGAVSSISMMDDSLTVSPGRLSTTATLYMPINLSVKLLNRLDLRWTNKIGLGQEFQDDGSSRFLRRYWSTGLVLSVFLDPHFTRSERLLRKSQG